MNMSILGIKKCIWNMKIPYSTLRKTFANLVNNIGYLSTVPLKMVFAQICNSFREDVFSPYDFMYRAADRAPLGTPSLLASARTKHSRPQELCCRPYSLPLAEIFKVIFKVKHFKHCCLLDMAPLFLEFDNICCFQPMMTSHHMRRQSTFLNELH